MRLLTRTAASQGCCCKLQTVLPLVTRLLRLLLLLLWWALMCYCQAQLQKLAAAGRDWRDLHLHLGLSLLLLPLLQLQLRSEALLLHDCLYLQLLHLLLRLQRLLLHLSLLHCHHLVLPRRQLQGASLSLACLATLVASACKQHQMPKLKQHSRATIPHSPEFT
jgi:hypothetical protein